MKNTDLALLIASFVLLGSPFDSRRSLGVSAEASAQSAEIRVGIIGTDTSHVTAFTRLLNDKTDANHVPGARVVAAFKGGSPDVEASSSRIDRFAAELEDTWGVEFVESIEDLTQKVDAVLLESVDGRPHLNQVRPVFKAKKRVFIDKPFTASSADAREIVRLSRESGVPFFSSSSLRFNAEVVALRKSDKHGGILGAFTFGPENLEPHHPDLFWYGIHAVEMLYTLLGPGCDRVTRVKTDSGDTVVGTWKDGRIGTMRGLIQGRQDYGAVVFGMKAVLASPVPMQSDYRGLLVEIVKFFQTGVPPIPPDETLEIMAFMEAVDLSKTRGGVPVALAEITRRPYCPILEGSPYAAERW
ncbi:MAG: Gfo/Idh/MocA family protein [Vicinamibacterales bacterium]